MTTDIHAHVIPDDLLPQLAEAAPSIVPELEELEDGRYYRYPSGRVSGPVPAGMGDTTARLHDMDAAGIRVQALSVPPTHFSYAHPVDEATAAARLHNDEMRRMAVEHPDRFRVLGTLPMQDPSAAVAEIERLRGHTEVVGLELGTNVAGTNLDDASFEPVWAAAAEVGFAIVLHPDNVAGHGRMKDHYLHNFVGNPTDTTLAAGSLMFGGVLSRHPALRVALLHGGGFLPYQIGRFQHGWEVRPEPRERCAERPRDLLRRFWFDTLTHDVDSLQFLIEQVGADRVCLGTDYPFDMADADPVGSTKAAAGSDEVLEALQVTTPDELLTRRPAAR